MSASISTKRKTIGVDFLKKTAGYISGATGAYISDAMTVTTSTISEAKNTVADVTAYSNTSIMPKLRQLKTQASFKGIFNWFMEREEGYSNSLESDIAMDFDIDTDPVEIGESQITEIGRNANQISEAVVSSSRKMVEAQLAATANLVNTAERQTAVIAAGFDKTNDTLNKILEVLTHNTSALIEATVASNSEKSSNDSLVSGGKFNLSEYKSMVSSNFKNSELGMAASMLPMLSGFVNPQDMVKLMLNAGLNKAAPNLKKNMRALDDAISDTIMTSLIRLGEHRDRFDATGTLAKIFGIDSSRKNVDTSRSSIGIKAVPFDTIAHEAITNAIPGYLRKILVAVGGEDTIYDYRSRSFKSKGAIQREFREASVNRGTIYNASSNVRNRIGTDDFSSMVYDLMMTELGSRTSNGSARGTVDKLSNNKEAEKYIKSLLSDIKLNKKEKEMLRIISSNVSSAASGTGAIDIMNQVAMTNVNRNSKMKSYVDNANDYNIDLSEIRDSVESDFNMILEENGLTSKRKRNKSGSVRMNNSPLAKLQGLNYTNMALYEIYRRLNEGINVFQVGRNNSRSEPFKKLGDDYLQKPQSYKAKPIGDYHGGAPVTRSTMHGPSSTSDEENLLRNQELEDGETENLTGGQRFVRWGKKRGGDLSRAIFSGSPEQVKDAFSIMIREAGQAAGDGIKHGAAKINDSSGNILGFLKHKITGAGYKTKDDDGNEIEIAKNEKGGFLGYFDELIFGEGGARGLAKRTTNMGSKWFKSVAGYFNYESDDNKGAKGVSGKRKQIISASVGAMMGAGLLGGPFGLIMGGIAGNAISQTDGIGDKIHKLLFGDKEHEGDKKKDRNKRRGLIGRAVDNIVDPIRYQVGKTMTSFSAVLKKNILGPLSNIGAAIKERMANAAGGVVSKVFGGIFKGATGVLKKLIMLPLDIARAPINMLGIGARGSAEIGGAVVGGTLNSLARSIAGKKGRSTINERIKSQKSDANADRLSSGYYGEYELDEDGNVVLDSKGRPKKLSKGRAYKAWKEKEDLRRDKMGSVNDYTSERVLTKEEKEAAEAAKRTEENTSEIADVQKKLTDAVTGEIIPGSSFKSHDTGVHERLDKLIEIARGNTQSSSISESDNKMLPAVVGSSIKSDKERQRQENISFGHTLIGAAVNAADEGGIDSDDAGILERITRDSQVGASQGSIFGRFKDLINRNKNKGDARKKDEEEKEESFLSNLLGGIGKVLVDNWPLVLGGLTLFSDKFREIAGELLQNFGGWLVENVPTIIKGVWDLAKGVNQEIENVATGAETVKDPVTNENKSVISAETHAGKVEQGAFSSAVESGLNPLRFGKDVGIVSLERAGLRLGAAGVQAGARAVGGGAGVANLATRAFHGGSAFVQGLAQNGLNSTGIHKATEFAGRAFTLGGSNTLEKASLSVATTATKAGGFKAMMSKTFNPKTWFNASSVANVAGGIASTAVASVSWDAVETIKNQNIVGDYGIAKNAGGYAQTNTTVKTITTTTIGVGGGIAIGAAVVSAKAAIATSIAAAAAGVGTAGAANAWNPVGWCALIIAGVLIIAAALAGLVNCLTGIFTDNANKDYAIRSNSSKLNGVITDRVSYENGADNAMYAYCAQESDRVLGFTKGVFIKDPELAFGKFLRTIADGLASSPGAEILLYDFLNNMAVQGVPFACLLAGDSEECKSDGAQANTASTGQPPMTREGPLGGNYTQVLKSTVSKNKSKVFSDIAANIKRQDPSAVWTEENLQYVYDAGKKVVDRLTSRGIIKSNGKIDTGKFKGTPGSKKNASGWDALEELARKNDSYFLTQCLVYINSKIEVTKDGKQWLEDRKDDITKLMDGLKDLFIKESEEQIAEMKAQGMSDKEIEDALIASRDPKGNQAKEAADQTEAASFSIPSVGNSNIRSSDKADVEKELKYLTASYAYAHPTILQKWVTEHESESSISPDNINRIGNWKNEFSNDKNKRQILRGEMANAALSFAESAGDIFNLIPKFDWSEGGKIYTGKKKAPAEKHGSGFVIRGQEKDPGKGILGKLWDSGEVGRDKTPEDIHDELFGDKNHGKGSEATNTGDQKWYVSTSGVLGRIADKISKYGSSEGEKLTEGKSGDKWRNVLLNLPANNPPGIGGGDDPYSVLPGVKNTADELNQDSVGDNNASLSDGNTKLPSPFVGDTFKVTSNYGWRTINGEQNYHSGIDLVPNSSDGKIGAVAPGVVTRVERNISGFKKGSYGNYVEYETPDGTRVMNAHMKEGSIPVNIKSGSSISPGDVIGMMGNTGNSYGDHLHLQLENSKFAKDPKGKNTADPASLLGVSTVSDTGNYSAVDGYSGMTTGYTDTSSSDSSASGKSGIAYILEMLKDAGSKFLNFITGGLYSLDSADQDSTTSSANDSYTYTAASGSSVTISGAGAHSAAAQLDPDIPIELLTNSEVNSISGFGGNGEVLDLKTGISYMVSLGGKPGGTHTDYTPLTPEDTEKKRTAATADGGSWPSWTPRPCILKIAGRQLAVGTHNYPHGSHIGNGNPGPSMPDNENSKPAGQSWPIGGHFCMYFKNSVSNANGLSKNARQHQEAAAEAYNLAVAMIEEQKRAEEAAAKVQDGNQASLWAYLKSKGMSDAAVAGILGCWEAESKNSARRIEADTLRGFPGYDVLINDRQAMNDYTKNVVWAKTKGVKKSAYYGADNNLYPGIGYAQWTGGRGQALIEFAKSTGKDWSAPSTQLDFMNNELNDPNSYYGPKQLNVLGKMSNTDDPSSAANVWAKLYEGNSGGADSSRISHAKSVYNRYKGSVPEMASASTELPAGGGDSNIPSANINLQSSSNIRGSRHKTKSLQRIGGASDSASVPGLATSINNKASSFVRRSSDDSLTSLTHTSSTDGDTSTKNIINLLYEVIDELKDIASNTGSSSELLGSLNEKDFVDKGLRDSMSSLTKTPKRNYGRHVQTNSANVRTVTAMARP